MPRGGSGRKAVVASLAVLLVLALASLSTASAAPSSAKLSAAKSPDGSIALRGSGFPKSSPVKIVSSVGNCQNTGTVQSSATGALQATLKSPPGCTGPMTVRAQAGGVAKQIRVGATAANATTANAAPVKVGPVTEVGWVTGEGGFTNTKSTIGVNGTDLGVMWDRGDGSVLAAFGDTYGGGWTSPKVRPAFDDWRRNFIVSSKSKDLAKGMELEAVNAQNNRAPEIIGKEADEITVIPTSGIEYKGKQYLHYMGVNHWGAPGVWNTRQAGVAFSDDGGATWNRNPNARIANEGGKNPFQLLAFAYGPDKKLYALGTPNGRFGDLHLARIDGFPDDLSKWVYWDGTKFVKDVAAAKAVAKGPAGEPSLAWHKGLRKWIVVYRETNQKALVIRTATKLTGPWTETQVLVPDSKYNTDVYGGMIHPWSVQSGSSMYFLMTRWDIYNVMLMKVDFTK